MPVSLAKRAIRGGRAESYAKAGALLGAEKIQSRQHPGVVNVLGLGLALPDSRVFTCMAYILFGMSNNQADTRSA